MSDAGDFFDKQQDPNDDGRDRYGRPRIVPRGMPKTVRIPYSRPSGYADKVANMEHIHRWMMRGLTRAMSAVESQDLRDLALGEVYDTSYDMVDDEGANRQSGRNLDSIMYRALDRIGWSKQADRGTAIHSFCEDRGRLWEVPEHLKPFVIGYWECIDREGIKILAVETFVANDEVQAAGTFDVLIWHPVYGVIVGDIKTGKLGVGFAVQKAIYANGDVYDMDTHERAPLESLSGGEEVNRKVGMIFDVKPEGTETYVVDLERAWEVAKAIRVVDTELKMDIMTKLPHRTLEARIMAATTADELGDIWRENKASWGDKHTAASKARLQEIKETS